MPKLNYDREPEIEAGIITDGEPELEPKCGATLVRNLLIGEGFHWQRRCQALMAGSFIPLSEPQGNIHVVNRLGIESYIESVTGSEMNPDAPLEFLKAHAIISRSWAMRKILSRDTPSHQNQEVPSCGAKNFAPDSSWEESDSHRGFDVCSDDHCQRYQGMALDEDSKPILSAAVDAARLTRGIVLTDSHGGIADTRFSKCCGGVTELFSSCWMDQDYDYLPSIADPWCDLSGMPDEERERFLKSILKNYDSDTADFRDWRAYVDAGRLRQEILAKYGRDLGPITSMKAQERGASGRIVRLQIEGTTDSIVIGKTLAIRRLLAANCLKSSWFDVTPVYAIGSAPGKVSAPVGFKLSGHGWGHGVGLCQIGAARMAFEGKKCEEILSFYYPNATLTRLYE